VCNRRKGKVWKTVRAAVYGCTLSILRQPGGNRIVRHRHGAPTHAFSAPPWPISAPPPSQSGLVTFAFVFVNRRRSLLTS